MALSSFSLSASTSLTAGSPAVNFSFAQSNLLALICHQVASSPCCSVRKSPPCEMCCQGKFPKSPENKNVLSWSNFKNSDRWLSFSIFLPSHVQFSRVLPTWIQSTLWNVLWLAICFAARRKPKTSNTECQRAPYQLCEPPLSYCRCL